jgi:hypothetical protein
MFANKQELENGIAEIQGSPSHWGTVDLIVRRPIKGEREVIDTAEVDLKQGLVGDIWLKNSLNKYPDRPINFDSQLTLMNSRTVALIAKTKDRWPLAGDQFYVDFDLSEANLPPGTMLNIGTAQIQVTAEPHLGCKKFLERYGKDALILVNSKQGRLLNLRGINAKVIMPGVVKVGDQILKLT